MTFKVNPKDSPSSQFVTRGILGEIAYEDLLPEFEKMQKNRPPVVVAKGIDDPEVHLPITTRERYAEVKAQLLKDEAQRKVEQEGKS